MITYKPRIEMLNEIVSMCLSGLMLEDVIVEIAERYQLTESEVSGFRNTYLFLCPYPPA